MESIAQKFHYYYKYMTENQMDEYFISRKMKLSVRIRESQGKWDLTDPERFESILRIWEGFKDTLQDSISDIYLKSSTSVVGPFGKLKPYFINVLIKVVSRFFYITFVELKIPTVLVKWKTKLKILYFTPYR